MDHSEDIEALSFEEANTSPSTPKPDIITPEKTSSEINVEMKVSMEQYDSVKKSAFSRAKVSFPTGFSENLTAWASVTSLMVITIPIGMPLYGIGLLIMDMRDELQTSTTLIGWIVSMSFFLNSSFAPIAGILVTSENFLSYIKLGLFMSVIFCQLAALSSTPTHLLITLGIGYGISSNLVYYTVSSQASTYFPHKHQIRQSKGASSYSILGFALAQIVSGIVFSYIMKYKTWHDALQANSMLLFIIGYAAIGCLEALPTTDSSQEQLSRNTRRNTLVQLPGGKMSSMLHNFNSQCSAKMFELSAFYLLIMDVLTFWVSDMVGIMFLPGEMADNGYKDEQINIMLVQGLGSSLGRLALSIASIFVSIKFFKLFPLKGAVLGVCFLSSFAISQPWSYYVLSLGVGFSNGIASGCAFTVTQEIVGRRSNGYTWVMLSQGVGCLIGPILGGFIYDQSGSYRLAFEIASTMACVSATLSVLASIARYSKARKKSIHEAAVMRRRSSKMVPLESLADRIYLKRDSTSYLLFERKFDKYQFCEIIDRPQLDVSHMSISVNDLFHGKFQLVTVEPGSDPGSEDLQSKRSSSVRVSLVDEDTTTIGFHSPDISQTPSLVAIDSQPRECFL